MTVCAKIPAISPEDWDACAVDDRLADGDAVTLGFDGGRTDDATALVAIRVRDRLIAPLGVWEKPDGPAGDGWEVDRPAVDGAVRNALERYDVQAFFADVALWESYVDAWSEDYRDRLVIKASPQSAVGRDMRGGLQELTLANERLVAAVEDGQDVTTYVYLAPEAARRFARSVTLASIAADGESVPKAPAERAVDPCPNDNAPCASECGARSECHRKAVADLFRPVDDTDDGEATREELFLAARELAGPAAGLDDVLKVAAYLAT
ncbi:hypothetical protein O1M07_26840 [Streptomyces albulus]|nr:hypothetical protein [Streptomyces noursei]MCZ1017730.1 hypothetical protein [Streptomyces noursei]